MNLKRILRGKFKFILSSLTLIASVLAMLIFSHGIIIDPIYSNFIYIEILSNNTFHEICLFVADTEVERDEGLMFQTSISPNFGMLFIFPSERRLDFWMYNTFIPLDMIFLNSEKKIIHIEYSATPFRTHPFYSSIYPAKYVIELKAGDARRLELNQGESFPVNAF